MSKQQSKLKPDVDQETINDLRTFAAKHGRTWRRELQRLWQRGQIHGRLYHLRNTHGPRWLWEFKP